MRCRSVLDFQYVVNLTFSLSTSKRQECRVVVVKHFHRKATFSAGYYCDMMNEPVTDYIPYPCPIGHYCVNGTRFSTEYPCPSGTYGPIEKLQSEEECSPCDPGEIHQYQTYL